MLSTAVSSFRQSDLRHTDDITVKQAVEYILAQPDGKSSTSHDCRSGD
jgi:hypothetical protein